MNRTILIVAMFLLALDGGILHYRIHPPFADIVPQETGHIHEEGTLHQHSQAAAGKRFDFSHGMATLFSLADIVLITALFLRKGTAIYGLLLKGMLAIFGAVMMTHFSIVELSGQGLTLPLWLLNSALPSILVAVAGFLLAKAIYESYLKSA